jgi:hypothetical protein
VVPASILKKVLRFCWDSEKAVGVLLGVSQCLPRLAPSTDAHPCELPSLLQVPTEIVLRWLWGARHVYRTRAGPSMALTSVVEACNNFLLALLAPNLRRMWMPASTDGHILSDVVLGAPGPTVVQYRMLLHLKSRVFSDQDSSAVDLVSEARLSYPSGPFHGPDLGC